MSQALPICVGVDDADMPAHMDHMSKKQSHLILGHNPERAAAAVARRASGAHGPHLQGTRGQRGRRGVRIAAIRDSAESNR